MKKITIDTLQNCKTSGTPFAVVAAYDALFASLIEAAGIEVLLVGDTLGMVLQGHDSTLPVQVADIAYHTRCVRRGTNTLWIIADMPFGSYGSLPQAWDNAVTLLQAGAHMVKVEGGHYLIDTVKTLTERGIPVCAHLGLTPQSAYSLGGFKVQGREHDAAETIYQDAVQLEEAGARLLVLECVPAHLATRISQALTIPVVGIGAGPGTDAQVLVLHDILGLAPRPLRFVRDFLAEHGTIQAALKGYADAVKQRIFPTEEHSF